MKRLTKSDIERILLSGKDLAWQDPNGRNQRLVLPNANQRRLLAFLLKSEVRQPKWLPKAFVTGLSNAYEGSDDPALTSAVSPTAIPNAESWQLKSIETEGFGGLNSWGGGLFRFNFDSKSLLLEGPNGSGKSSLISALIWALSGVRPRDQADSNAHEPRPVFATNDRRAGDWPPIATYPPSVAELLSVPPVRVKLTFEGSNGSTARVERTLKGGNVSYSVDPIFNVPSVLIETGLLMPTRFAKLGLIDGRDRLTDAVQKLTGLDDLVAIGKLAEGLCHKSREFRSYKKRELQQALEQFREFIQAARTALAPVKEEVQPFNPKDTNDSKGQMARFGKQLNERATNLTNVIAADLAKGLDLSNPQVQHQVIVAIAGAEEDLEIGLDRSRDWQRLRSIAQAFSPEESKLMKVAIATTRAKCDEAMRLVDLGTADSRFQVKALAAKWHSEHVGGPVEYCPLCKQTLTETPLLVDELEQLRASGDAAARTFDDNLNAIRRELHKATPVAVRQIGAEILELDVRESLIQNLRDNFVREDRYADFLVGFGALVESALTDAPVAALTVPGRKLVRSGLEGLEEIRERLVILEHLLAISNWFASNSTSWIAWWTPLATRDTSQTQTAKSLSKKGPSIERAGQESLSAHLSRLSDALTKAEPYRVAAGAMRNAWSAGKTAAEIEKEVNRRDKIADSLMPLKNLGPLCDAIARDAIDGLSTRISRILERIHLTEQLQFQKARLERKQGLVVRGEMVPELSIDATYVANTSWVRAVLWAFLFSLREEAIEQLGSDPFPLLVFDDPQSTFDAQHRHMWAQYVVSLQSDPTKIQLLLTTHDENFLDLIKVDGIVGRQALIAAPGPNSKHVDIFEGEALDREWTKTLSAGTPAAGVSYLIAVRKYTEGMLKLMLRGQDADILQLVIGSLRERLNQYHTAQKAPWNQAAFKKLVAKLEPGRPEVRYIEGSHHTTGRNYGMGEATSVEEFWRKELKPTLDRACRTAREHRLVHGGLSALYGGPPSVVLPEGYQERVRSIQLRVIGRAAALTDGRIADGAVDMDQFAAGNEIPVTLGRHFAYRLTASTLEPVARAGDILFVKEHGEPSQKSLALAISEDRILARRFEIAENHTDIAVLTAQAINPREIAPPMIAHRATFRLYKIIGVLYENSAWNQRSRSNDEVCDCGGEAVLKSLTVEALGLIQVMGQSAEPYALNGQHLIVKKPVTPRTAIKSLHGQPVIASDTEGNTYFKRLRRTSDHKIVLESLDNSGTHDPVILSAPARGTLCLDSVWPIAGVLFEQP